MGKKQSLLREKSKNQEDTEEEKIWRELTLASKNEVTFPPSFLIDNSMIKEKITLTFDIYKDEFGEQNFSSLFSNAVSQHVEITKNSKKLFMKSHMYCLDSRLDYYHNGMQCDVLLHIDDLMKVIGNAKMLGIIIENGICTQYAQLILQTITKTDNKIQLNLPSGTDRPNNITRSSTKDKLDKDDDSKLITTVLTFLSLVHNNVSRRDFENYPVKKWGGVMPEWEQITKLMSTILKIVYGDIKLKLSCYDDIFGRYLRIRYEQNITASLGSDVLRFILFYICCLDVCKEHSIYELNANLENVSSEILTNPNYLSNIEDKNPKTTIIAGLEFKFFWTRVNLQTQ